MKKQAVICLMLCGLFLLIGCGSVFDADFPPPPFESLYDYSIVTGTGITDAFLQNEEIRSLFETIAYNSLLLEPGRYTIVKYLDSYAYYSGREELPHVFFDNEVMEDAVFKLTEYTSCKAIKQPHAPMRYDKTLLPSDCIKPCGNVKYRYYNLGGIECIDFRTIYMPTSE